MTKGRLWGYGAALAASLLIAACTRPKPSPPEPAQRTQPLPSPSPTPTTTAPPPQQPTPPTAAVPSLNVTLEIVEGDQQKGTPGENFGHPLVIQVKRDNRPWPGVMVAFLNLNGDAVLHGPDNDSGQWLAMKTDADGKAQVILEAGGAFAQASQVEVSVKPGDGMAPLKVYFDESTSAGDEKFDAPTNTVRRDISPTEVELSWENHASEATELIIEQSEDGGKTWRPTAVLTDITTSSYRVTGLKPDVAYDFRIYDHNNKNTPPSRKTLPARASTLPGGSAR